MKIRMRLLTRIAGFLSGLVAIVFALASTLAYADAASSSYDASREYRKAITIEHTDVLESDLISSSIPVSLSSGTHLANLANDVGDHGNNNNHGNNGDHARFTAPTVIRCKSSGKSVY